MNIRKRIALIAHDHQKPLMVEWVKRNAGELKKHELLATGTTGTRIETDTGIAIQKMKSGPLGGDAQISAKMVNGEIDLVIFFWDPMSPHPHDVDVKALLRLAVLYNVPIACSQATADFIIASPLMAQSYDQTTQALVNQKR